VASYRFTYTFEVDPRTPASESLGRGWTGRQDDREAMALIESMRESLDQAVRGMAFFEFDGSSTLEGPQTESVDG
jgi:hypothetical protein